MRAHVRLIASNWAVDSKSAVALMTGAFAALAANPKLSHAEALAEIRVKRTNTRAHNSNADEMALPRNSMPCLLVDAHEQPMRDCGSKDREFGLRNGEFSSWSTPPVKPPGTPTTIGLARRL